MIQPAPSGFERTAACAIWRTLDATQGPAYLEGTIPANVYACLNVLPLGEVRLNHPQGRSLPPVFLTGPLTVPLTTYAAAPLRSLSLVLQPWVLPAWFRLDATSLVDAIVDGTQAQRLNDPPLVDALRRAVDDPDCLVSALQMLAGESAGMDEEAPALADTLLKSSSVAAAAGQLGIGIRQLERRCRRTFGLGPKQWLQVKRFESSLRHLAQDEASLVDVSAEAGYADQSHMTRIYRRAAGHTPAQTKDAIDSDVPGYWAFMPSKTALPE
ncbi:MAG TPA: helix-turn-helix domain-containing protein [Noviherbaspirillum sp.]|uniref:helix-turn-helix domain-containing protein n=1 Tax=Noviherbaspirillum sp. TaxID=1926288 RepID=UPI002D29E012|nr:helix-turn-helix domain-containing protein [Noviherbaspirillum sp.]HYD94670.1 helix-turn-helix domain-containing protein [Noviherbaspirillum sp.]